MPRKWLPDHVTEYTDRHGKKRYRYRRTGYPVLHFKAQPGTPEFLVELDRAKGRARIAAASPGVVRGSLDDLIAQFYKSPKWLGMADNSRATYRGIIERYRERRNARGRYGGFPVAMVTTRALDAHIGKMSATPGAANSLRKTLKRLFAYAVKIGMRSDNPAALTDGFKTGKGFHTWTEVEIGQYRARHPLGTKARLALELLLNTASRRCNVVKLGRADLRDGRFQVAHVKDNNAASIVAMPETLAAIEAMPVVGIGPYLVTEFGKPFTAPGFGNKMREWCDQADLPQCSAHGLRKAMSRRLAEANATDAQGQAVTGHKRDRTFAHYRDEADREGLADTALANLETHLLANRAKD